MLYWYGVLTGIIVSLFAHGVFTQRFGEGETYPDTLHVKDFSSRSVIMSCQSCRKLKSFKEIEPDLYQCPKCKRHVDLRKSSW